MNLLFASEFSDQLFQHLPATGKIRAYHQQMGFVIMGNPGKGFHEKIQSFMPYIQPAKVGKYERICRYAELFTRRRDYGVPFWKSYEIRLDQNFFPPKWQDIPAPFFFPMGQKMQTGGITDKRVEKIQIGKFFDSMNQPAKMQLAM